MSQSDSLPALRYGVGASRSALATHARRGGIGVALVILLTVLSGHAVRAQGRDIPLEQLGPGQYSFQVKLDEPAGGFGINAPPVAFAGMALNLRLEALDAQGQPDHTYEGPVNLTIEGQSYTPIIRAGRAIVRHRVVATPVRLMLDQSGRIIEIKPWLVPTWLAISALVVWIGALVLGLRRVLGRYRARGEGAAGVR